MPEQDLLADDPEHPIPRLAVIDVHAVWKTGGSDLGLVIASPLRDDERSRQRLLRKIENYLNFVVSSEYAAEFGNPLPTNTAIVIKIHPDSDSEIVVILERLRGWVEGNGASLRVEPLDPTD